MRLAIHIREWSGSQLKQQVLEDLEDENYENGFSGNGHGGALRASCISQVLGD